MFLVVVLSSGEVGASLAVSGHGRPIQASLNVSIVR